MAGSMLDMNAEVRSTGMQYCSGAAIHMYSTARTLVPRATVCTSSVNCCALNANTPLLDHNVVVLTNKPLYTTRLCPLHSYLRHFFFEPEKHIFVGLS